MAEHTIRAPVFIVDRALRVFCMALRIAASSANYARWRTLLTLPEDWGGTTRLCATLSFMGISPGGDRPQRRLSSSAIPPF